jgi:16S rRNA (guanine527-N7)-methyltransferase
VGSGAGFPGLVLAACYPETTFTLLEPHKRRAGFLELQISELGLINAVIDTRRLEEVEESGFHVAVARAFSDPNQALRSMLRVVGERGDVIVAVGAGTPEPSDENVRSVSIGDTGPVDSPGRFFMMTRGA